MRPDRAGAGRRRVLFISADPVGQEMAGLGIRYWELARTLVADAQVTIAHGGVHEGHQDGIRTVPYRPHHPAALRSLIAEADVTVTHPQWPLVTRWLRQSAARVIFDLYDPETLETLELLAGQPRPLRRLMVATTVDRLQDALRSGHHFMCASERQRDLWLGAMLARRVIGPNLYDRDPSLRGVIDTVPFGLPSTRPQAEPGRGPRELLEGIDSSHELVLWNGGIWGWLDAPTAIRAVAQLAARRPRLRLVFMGSSEQPAAASATAAAKALAGQLGVLGSIVRFHHSWVPYAERASWLLAADCAISTHLEHLEARFAFRTRVLDCFWAGVPVVCTAGDDLADRVARERLGAVVQPGDVAGTTVALEEVLDRGRAAYAEALARAATDYAWPRVAGALRAWTADPSPPPARRAMAGLSGAERARRLAYQLGGRTLLDRRHRP